MDKKETFHSNNIWSSISNNRTVFDLLENNLVSSWNIIVLWKWFEDVIYEYKDHLELDIRIYLTLNSGWRWDNPWWIPILTNLQEKTLVNSNWKFDQSLDEIFENISYEYIKSKLSNIFEGILRIWLKFSYLDTHMWVLLHKKLFWVYKELVELFLIEFFIYHSKEWGILWNRFYGCEGCINNLVQKWYKYFDNFDVNAPNKWQKADSDCIINRNDNRKD